MMRQNSPAGMDSDLTGTRFHPGESDRYVMAEMVKTVKAAQAEPLSGKRVPRFDDEGHLEAFLGSATLKPKWMQASGGKTRGEYYGTAETLAVLEALRAGQWPKTKKRDRIASVIESALRLDAEDEKAAALGGFDPAEFEAAKAAIVRGPVSRPSVVVDRAAGTFTLRPRSPFRPNITRVNSRRGETVRMKGHKAGCRCVGCSLQTRARGMAALRQRPQSRGRVLSRFGDLGSVAAFLRAAPRKPRRIPSAARRAQVSRSARASVRAPARTNPPRGVRVIGRIPGRLLEVRYNRRGPGTRHPGLFKHVFGPGVQAFAMSDGSVVIRGLRKPVWVRQ